VLDFLITVMTVLAALAVVDKLRGDTRTWTASGLARRKGRPLPAEDEKLGRETLSRVSPLSRENLSRVATVVTRENLFRVAGFVSRLTLDTAIRVRRRLPPPGDRRGERPPR
jgi:hypothetical protein